MSTSRAGRRAGITAALAVAPFALAWRFAHSYRARAGYPRRFPPTHGPEELGLRFEPVDIDAGEVDIPGWWIPARTDTPGPAVLLVHGWESARDRTLPNALFLHAAGFHVLTFDVRGHGANPAESLPVTAGEFGSDALAATRVLLDRPEVTSVAILGHSMGAIGSLLAAAAEPRVAAVVATATPADPWRLTRQTFHLAHLPIPDPIAYPLAWLTARVFLEPRGHRVEDVSATRAIERYLGPVLLVHGSDDRVVPPGHMARLASAARASRVDLPDPEPVETLIVEGGQHSWLYESPAYRERVARFLATALAGPLSPDDAAAAARATAAARRPDAEARFSALEGEPGGVRTLARAVTRRAPRTADAPQGRQGDDLPVGPAPTG
jgi:alpha-beta hydrolase superfamily lysophospholipase